MALAARACALFALMGALAGPPSAARADIAAGDDKLLHGGYAEAIAAYRGVKGKEAGRAQVRLGRALLSTGDLPAARAAAEAAAKSADRAAASDGKVLAAELDLATGHYSEAQKALEELTRREPRHLRARVELGLAYRALGQKALADKVWNSFYDDHETGKLDESKAETLVYLALAARYLEDFRGASDTLQDAVGKDKSLLEANLEWGSLFLDKYNAADAEQSFAEVLKLDPKNPDAHAGLARAKIDQSYDVRTALAEVDQALAVNPIHAEALLVRAELQIDNGEHAAASDTLAKLLAVNPQDARARTLQATIHWLEDDSAGFEAEKKKVLAVNPGDAAFYHTVADFAVKEHRYKEALALEREALKIDPKDALALAGLGTGYLRMGDEQNGLRYLRDAWKRDSFNVRTYNILNLFEDTIPTKYEMVVPPVPKGVFRLRVPKEERAILERYLPRTLGRAFDDMVKRYGFTPSLPITIELFTDPEQYSVRTVGLPNLGALGVCFGQVITALSPSNGNVNWGMILWHELGHVFAIQLSNSRVPRWFTEGLSEYETLIARPEWRRENDVDVWSAYQAGQLPSVLELNSRFLRAKDMADMVVAYHMSSVTVEYLARTYGFPKIVAALKLYGQGKSTAEVLPAITGESVERFDADFRKYLDQRLAVYRGSFRVDPGDYTNLAALEKAAAAAPRDAEAQAALALGDLAAERPDRALAAADAALQLDGKNKKALFASAEVLTQRGDADGARARLRELIAAGGDGYDARLRLGRLALERDDLAEAESELSAAKKLDPERSEPSLLLSERYFKVNREDDGLRELERYAMIEQMELAPVRKLVEKYAARKNWAKVRDFGEMAVYINPFDAEIHLALADAYGATAAPDSAVFEYESALKAEPPLRRPAVAELGLARVLADKHDVAGAKRALERALKLEPENADALALARKIGK
jgi:tetratricopeptide (TPR) repeat protein